MLPPSIEKVLLRGGFPEYLLKGIIEADSFSKYWGYGKF
jgi:hypothetical protein